MIGNSNQRRGGGLALHFGSWDQASDRWQVERKRRIVGHGGCGARLVRDATCLDSDLLRESRLCCHSRHRIPHPSVESRRGAVAWAMRHRPVSPPRSSNRTGRFPASGFPTGFIVGHTAAAQGGRVSGAAHRVYRRPDRTGTRAYLARAPCAVW